MCQSLETKEDKRDEEEKDPSRFFNSSLGGNTRRAIDIREAEKIDEEALKALVRAAVTLNTSKPRG